MCTIVAIPVSAIPKVIFTDYQLERRVHDRGGDQPEVWFAHRDPQPLLPVIDGGAFKLLPWGSNNDSSRLPRTGWTWRSSIDGGAWNDIGCPTEMTIIPVTYGHEKGIWFKITEGIHGLIARPTHESPTVYMICEPPTRYFKVMTRSQRMPWLIDEVI